MPSPNEPYPTERHPHDQATARPGGTQPFPPRIQYPALSGLPVPVQAVVSTAALPLEVAVTSVKLLKNVESLLGELTFHLRALRPAVSGISQAYGNGHFDAALRTIDQIQHSTSAIAFVWAPFNAVRDVITSAQPKPPVPRPTGAVPGPPLADRPAWTAPATPAAPSAAAPGTPSMTEWLGGLGGMVLDQAATLPGGAMFTRAFRRPAAQSAPPGYELITAVDDRWRVEPLRRLQPIEPNPEPTAGREPTAGPEPRPDRTPGPTEASAPEPGLLDLAAGPIRKLFGRS